MLFSKHRAVNMASTWKGMGFLYFGVDIDFFFCLTSSLSFSFLLMTCTCANCRHRWVLTAFANSNRKLIKGRERPEWNLQLSAGRSLRRGDVPYESAYCTHSYGAKTDPKPTEGDSVVVFCCSLFFLSFFFFPCFVPYTQDNLS